ncbi:MAG: phytanoyl-CoA dioxygenase family protein [Rhodospirillaceae bacterium]|nr:phytanoyl-CoA dioxygenase family protein [Rhodospirillaceae bacterium]
MLTAWEEDGFLILDGFHTFDACEKLRARALEIVEAFDPQDNATIFSTTDPDHVDDDYFRGSGDKIRCFLEEEAVGQNGRSTRPKSLSVNKIGHAMHDLDPVFSSFARAPQMEPLITGLGIGEPLLLQSMYIFKQPEIGGEVTCHQDSTFLWTEPQTCIGFWSAIDAASIENGCLWAEPGSHRGPLRARHHDVDGRLVFETLDDTPWPSDGLAAIDAQPGTLVVLHGQLPHLSAPNRSTKPRHAHTLHVIDGRAHYPRDNWLRRGADMPLRGFR